MLDIHFIRENKELVKEAAQKKHVIFDVDALITLDDKRLSLARAVEDKRALQNKASEEISRNEGSRDALISKMQTLKSEMEKEEEELKLVMGEWRNMMLQVPNIPDVSVPDGESDAENKEVKVWGGKTTFDFEPKDHMEVMKNLEIVDFERGVKVHGFRGYFLIGESVQLSFAIWNYALDFFSKKSFMPVMPPVIDRRENFIGTGMIPQNEDDLYKTQDGNYLAGTAEVPMMGFHMNEVLDKSKLPLKYLGFSPCFRLEIGSYSKDVKGLIRVNEFYKLEQVILCEASHEESVKLHEEINRNIEEFIESLKIPYRTVINCGADLGLGQVKKYDVELWVPKEGKYREISSASYFHDFQTRRLNIRYKGDDGKLHYAHSLNSTAISTPRLLVSLVENYQQADGSIKIPEVLVPYIKKEVISHK